MEGDPVERLANDPTLRPGHEVYCTFEEALEVIRKTDNLTRGIPKIIYLVGWQKGGHDHGYPARCEVNPRMKRAQDATALDSLRWLIREARTFNTTVSLHINMADAYKHSPLWDEYVAKDCFAKDKIIAYSRDGYENKSWQLPDDWKDAKSVDLYKTTLEGCVPLKKDVPVTGGKLVLSLGKDEAVSVVPAGTKLVGESR